MRRSDWTTRMALLMVAVSVAAVAIALWALSAGQQGAGANPTLSVGLDFDPSGTAANGVYDPVNLPPFEACLDILPGQAFVPGQQFSIDLFVLDVSQLVAFSSHLQYDQTKLKVVGSQVLLFLNAQPQSAVLNASQNDPDPVSGVLLTPDTDGLYEAAAADTGNESGDTGSGVLARVTFEALAAGFSTVSIPYLDFDSDGLFDTGIMLRDANGVRINDVNPVDGWYDWPFINQQGTVAVSVSDMDGDGTSDGCDPDRDGDGILQDGDASGFEGDNPCTGGNAINCDDNCPWIPNPNQEDFNGDGIGDVCAGDADGDGYWVTQEEDMGSDPDNPASTPEVCDGLDNDADTQVDEGYDLNSNGVPDCDDANADTDGDLIANPTDTDDDNDGTIDSREIAMGIDTLADCPLTTTHYAWMPDISNNQIVSIADVLKFIPHFLTFEGQPGYNRRFDWNANGVISIQDVLLVIPYFLTSCTP